MLSRVASYAVKAPIAANHVAGSARNASTDAAAAKPKLAIIFYTTYGHVGAVRVKKFQLSEGPTRRRPRQGLRSKEKNQRFSDCNILQLDFSKPRATQSLARTSFLKRAS
jgi:hypothetical protein